MRLGYRLSSRACTFARIISRLSTEIESLSRLNLAIAIITDADVARRILKHLGLCAPRQIERAPPAVETRSEAALPADNVLTYRPVPDIA